MCWGSGEGVAEGFGNHLVKAQNRAGRFIPSKQEANPRVLHRRQNKLWSPGARQLRRGPGCWQVSSFVVKHRGVHAVLQGQLRGGAMFHSGGDSVPSGLKGGLADDSEGSEETHSKHT